MSNNVRVAISADTAGLQVKAAMAKAAITDLSREVNRAAREMLAGDTSDELRARALSLSQALINQRAALADLTAQQRAAQQAQASATGITGQQRMALMVTGEQFRQMSTEVALGIPPMQIFAQQAGQTIQAMSMMFGEASTLGAFLSGGWGIALTTAVAVVAPLAAKLFETDSAMKEVKFSSYALHDAQNILANVMDITTGKIETQNKSLIALAHAQLAVARVESERRAADARTAIADSGKPQLTMSGGMGGGFSIERQKQPGWQIESQFRNGVINADQAISKLEQLRDRGQMTADVFGKLASAYANAGVEAANMKVYSDAEKLLAGEGGKDILKPKKEKKTKGPSATQDWNQELRAQEIAANDFFGDQTERELQFWQGKLALTKQGSREWLEVQGHIYDSSKTLARQAYQDHLADLNLQIEADRNSWSKTQADWAEKLAFIKSKFGEQSDDYKNAAREWTRIQAQHDEQELKEAQQHGERMVEALRRSLDTQATIRQNDASVREAQINASAGAMPGGNIAAAQKMAALYQQLAQQQLADTQTLYAAQSAALDEAIARATAKYGQDRARYQDLLDAKLEADRQYAAQRRVLESQQRVQAIQDTNAVKNAYRSYIQGTVQASVSGFTGLLTGQKTWAQAASGIYQSVLQAVEQQLVQMATTWIIEHLLMKSVAKQTTGDGAKSYVGQAGAAGVASMAAAPFPLNLGAPAFGAAMATAAGAFAAMASFDVGTNVLPTDMIAQVHAGERIVPAADNAKLLELTAMGAGAAGGGHRSGDTHLHYNPTINGAMPFGDQLTAHENHLISIIKRAKRRGSL
ncbi:UNVERIFIED_ORG: hypothetical protein M2348_000700 [Sphingomonas sp. R1F5B]